MPVQACEFSGKPGWRWGGSGKCYTYEKGNKVASDNAKARAEKQGAAAHASGFKESLVGERLLEIALSDPAGLKIDREAGVLHGVRVLGLKSLNGREYEPSAVARAVGLYEGKQVNFGHAERNNPDRERTIQERAGWLQAVRIDFDGGLSADLHLFTSDPQTGKVFEAATRRPDQFGLSHNSDGRVRRVGGKALVEEIYRVRSVDIVSDPATTRGLFESEERRMESLREAGGLVPGDTAPADATAGGGSGDEVKDAFKKMVMGVLDDDALDLQGKVAKIKEILKAEEKLSAKSGAGAPADAVAEAVRLEGCIAPSGNSCAPLSPAQLIAENRRLKSELDARALLESAGVQPSEIKILALAALPGAGEKKALLETWRGGAQQVAKPKSFALLERKDGKAAPVKDAEDFAKKLTE